MSKVCKNCGVDFRDSNGMTTHRCISDHPLDIEADVLEAVILNKLESFNERENPSRWKIDYSKTLSFIKETLHSHHTEKLSSIEREVEGKLITDKILTQYGTTGSERVRQFNAALNIVLSIINKHKNK